MINGYCANGNWLVNDVFFIFSLFLSVEKCSQNDMSRSAELGASKDKNWKKQYFVNTQDNNFKPFITCLQSIKSQSQALQNNEYENREYLKR